MIPPPAASIGSLAAHSPGPKKVRPPSVQWEPERRHRESGWAQREASVNVGPGVSLCPKERDMKWQMKHPMTSQKRPQKEEKALLTAF